MSLHKFILASVAVSLTWFTALHADAAVESPAGTGLNLGDRVRVNGEAGQTQDRQLMRATVAARALPVQLACGDGHEARNPA